MMVAGPLSAHTTRYCLFIGLRIRSTQLVNDRKVKGPHLTTHPQAGPSQGKFMPVDTPRSGQDRVINTPFMYKMYIFIFYIIIKPLVYEVTYRLCMVIFAHVQYKLYALNLF